MTAESNPFAKRLHELRKERRWSQGALAQKIGTSAAIVGRYERAEMTPSIDVARNVAQVFGVSLDYLLSDQQVPDLLRDKQMMQRWVALEGLARDDRERILFVIDGLIRDSKARQAYGQAG